MPNVTEPRPFYYNWEQIGVGEYGVFIHFTDSVGMNPGMMCLGTTDSTECARRAVNALRGAEKKIKDLLTTYADKP